MYFLEKEPGISTIAVILTTFILFIFTDLGIDSIFDNLSVIMTIFLCYSIVGIFWSFAKWYFYLLDWVKKDKILPYSNKKIKPIVRDNRSKIIAWILYWPLSFISTFIKELIYTRLSKFYSKIDNVYQKISNYVFRQNHE